MTTATASATSITLPADSNQALGIGQFALGDYDDLGTFAETFVVLL